MQFLDSVGLAYFWEKIKSRISSDIAANVTNKLGRPIGICALGADFKVPAANLPGYVDDIKEFNGIVSGVTVTAAGVTEVESVVLFGTHFVGLLSGKYYNTWASVKGMDAGAGRPENWGTLDGTSGYTPLTDKIYVNTKDNKVYRWSGTAMVEISASLALGETSATAYAGDKGKALADKLSGIETGANKYSLPLAASGTRGGIQVGYAANGKNYPVQLNNEKAYVNVPWTDTIYSLPTASSTTKGGITLGYTQSGKNYPVALDGDGKAYVNVPWVDTNTTYDLSPYAKTADVNTALAKKVDVVSGKGLSTNDFTAAYKTKLDGIAAGATADSAIPTSVIDALS